MPNPMSTLTLAESMEFRRLTGWPASMVANLDYTDPQGPAPEEVAGAMLFIVRRRTESGLAWEQVTAMPIAEIMAIVGSWDDDDGSGVVTPLDEPSNTTTAGSSSPDGTSPGPGVSRSPKSTG